MTETLEIVSRTDLGQPSWNAFVEACDEAWLWHRFEFQETLCTWPGRADASFAVLDRAGGSRVAAVVPLHVVRVPAAPYRRGSLDSLGGPAFANGLGARHRERTATVIREHLLRLARQARAVEANLALSPMAPALRGERLPKVNPLLRLGCENTLTQTWVIDLRPGREELWTRMEGRARTAVRKANKAELHVHPAHTTDHLTEYYALHCETYSRTGARPHPRAYFEAIWRDFLAKGHAHVLFAALDDQVVAAENFAVYKGAALYWTGAASERGLALGASSLLQWSAMGWMVDKGLEWYETGEAFPGARDGKLKGLSDFKKGFGGELYPYYRGRLRVDAAWRPGPIRRLATALRRW